MVVVIIDLVVDIVVVVVHSVNKMLPSVKFAEYKVLTFVILGE